MNMQVVVDCERLGTDVDGGDDGQVGAGTIEIDPVTNEVRIRGGASNAALGDTVNNLQERNNFNSVEGSSSTTTGAVVVTGGVGIGENLNIGGHQRIDSTKLAGDGAGPALEVAGGVKVAQDLHVNATTASTDSTNGALVVAGGTGVAGSLHVGSDNLLGDVNGPAMTVQGSLQTGQQVSVQSNELARSGGTTGPTAALQVGGGVNVNDDLFIRGTNDCDDGDAALEVIGGARVGRAMEVGSGLLAAEKTANSQQTGALRVQGGVGVQGQVHCEGVLNYSDRRLKADIENLGPDALERVNQLNGCTFTWKSTGAKDVGLIAQDVLAAAPHCVNDQSEYLSVNYSKLVPYLVEGMKELTSQVHSLKKRIRTLEGEEAPHGDEAAPRDTKRLKVQPIEPEP
jgi:hypothetical protein